MIRGADLSHADICEYPRNSRPRKTSTRNPPATFITSTGHSAALVRGPSTPVADCPVTSAGLAWPGRGCRTVPWHGTARLRDLRCVVAVARQARMLRSPKLQCESGRTARGSSRPRLRAPASGGHPSQSSTGQDSVVVSAKPNSLGEVRLDGCEQVDLSRRIGDLAKTTEAELVADDVGISGGVASAEEAAVHIIDDEE